MAAKRSRSAVWGRLAIYYAIIGAALWYQQLRRSESDSMACKISEDLATSVLLISYQVR
jgi:hypothetical protein